jgi:hypothetical protein
VIAVLTAVVIAAYVVVALLYAAGGRSTSIEQAPLPEPGAVEVEFAPIALDGPAERLSLDVHVDAPDSVIDQTDGITVNAPLTVVITPIDGTQSVVLGAGDLAHTTKTVQTTVTGAIENWPFDRYVGELAVFAFTTFDGEKQAVPVTLHWAGYISGWDFRVVEDYSQDLGELKLPSGATPLGAIVIDAKRSGSTFAFGFLLLGVMVVIPVLVLFVAIRAFSGRRKVEATLMSWMGAMLFATIPLRAFLPGSPPIGAWIDFLIVLWVIVALVAGLAIYVMAWNRWGSPAVGEADRGDAARRD